MWSCASSRPFIELARTPYLSELDFGCWRIHIKIDWRPKGWDEAAFQARLSHWLDDYLLSSRQTDLGNKHGYR
jgi:hypothetical protein